MTNTTDTQADRIRGLILDAQKGSGDAASALRAQYSPLIAAMLNALNTGSLSGQELADLREEADRKLLDAVYSYDTEQKEVTFGLYAQVCIRNALISELRRIESLHRLTVIPLDDPRLEGLASADDPARRAAERERYEELCRTIRTELSPLENRIWWAFMAGSKTSEIAASIGKPEKSVHNAIYRIRQKLRRRLSDTGE